MDMLKKRLAIALTLALCVMPISAPLAFAETIPSVEVEETTPTPNEETTTEPSTDAEIITDIEETNVEEETETNEPEDIAENETGEAPEGTESVDEDLPPVLNENGEVISPGTLPDSPFYWLTTLIEKLQVVLTFDPVKKTELLEEQALERIAEAGALIEKGDTEEAEGALKAYTAKVAEAEAFVDQLTQTDSEIKQKLETALSTTQANNVQTLGGLLDKLPPQAAQRVAVNIVRSMEKSIAKMDKKEQQRVAKELKRATEDLEESELTEEEVVALENLDQVLEDGQLEEEAIAATPSAAFNTMALTTDSNRQSLVLDAKGKVTKAKSEANSEFEPTKQQAQKLKAKVEDKNQSKDVSNQKPEVKSIDPAKDKTKAEAEAEAEAKSKAKDEAQAEVEVLKEKLQQEQKLQEGNLQKESEKSALKEKDQSSSNSAQKQTGEKTQQKASKDREKGDKSGGNER